MNLWKILSAGVKLGPIFFEKSKIRFIPNRVKTANTLN